jgi:hypothetical protein
MTLEFLNPSRSFDEVRKAIRFIGHDGMFEVPFFVEVEALDKSSVGLRSMERSQEMYLSTFDSARRSIENVAREAYSHGRQTSYTLTRADFG